MAERRATVQTLIAIAVGVAAYFGAKSLTTALTESLGKWPAIVLAGAAATLTGFLTMALLDRLAKPPRD